MSLIADSETFALTLPDFVVDRARAQAVTCNLPLEIWLTQALLVTFTPEAMTKLSELIRHLPVPNFTLVTKLPVAEFIEAIKGNGADH